MGDLVPDAPRIDRGALERIIRRAAELQASERDIGEGLTEQELLRLGEEVGIPAANLQQALLEERTRAAVTVERGLAGWLAGPRVVAAQRSIAGEPDRIQSMLGHWMTERELLTVKRRFPDRTSWEPRRDLFSSLKRELKVGGRPYRLATARDVTGQVSRIDAARCYVRLVADLANTRTSHLVGGSTMTGLGAVATAIGVTLQVALPVAIIPAVLGTMVGVAITRRRRSQVEGVQIALEQVLDHLEHADGSPNSTLRDPRVGALERIAQEIRKSLGA